MEDVRVMGIGQLTTYLQGALLSENPCNSFRRLNSLHWTGKKAEN